MDELEIRYTKESDREYLKKWLKEDSKYFPFTTPKEIEDGAKNWIFFYRYKASLTGEINKNVCSIATLFLMPYKKLVHHAMFYMIVDKNYRNRGVGYDMLKNIINLAQNYFKLESIFAEIYGNCPIIKLLKKFNFNQIVLQEKYVKIGNEYMPRILFDIWFK